MEMTAADVITCGSSWSELERAWVINKKPHSLGVPFFSIDIFKSVAHFYAIKLAMNFDFPRISKKKL